MGKIKTRSSQNGFIPNFYAFDELEYLRLMYSPEQIRKIWEGCRPKLSKISGKVIITGTQNNG